MPALTPLILFGAFDRHNFGDLLLGHCAAAGACGRPVFFAGLAVRDLRSFGGFRTQSLDVLVDRLRNEHAEFVHVGGEILTTTAWEAAVMLQTPEDARRAIALHDRDGGTRGDWAAEVLRTRRRLPYVVGASELPSRWRVHFRAAGGVAFAGLSGPERDEVLHALGTAASVSVRDRRTREALRAGGVDARLVRDPVAGLPALFGAEIREHCETGEVGVLKARLGRWIAVQLAAQRGDDGSLDRLAQAVSATARRDACGVVLFRAGLAPWHDDREVLERLERRLSHVGKVVILESAHAFDICALLANSVAYVGTSLHGWIVANAFDVPAHCIVDGAGDKAAAYLDTWGGGRRQWRTLAEEDLVPPLRVSG